MGNVLHCGRATRWGDALPGFGVGWVVQGALGQRGTWGDGVHGDLVGSQFQYQATSEHFKAGLGHAIGGEVAVRLVPRHARHEEDAPTLSLCFHLPCGKLGEEKTALQIDRHQSLEVLRRVLEEIAVSGDTRIGNGQIQLPKLRNCLIHKVLQKSEVAGIAGHGKHTAALCGNLACCPSGNVSVEVVEQNMGSPQGQLPCNFEADALARPGDNGCLILKCFFQNESLVIGQS